MKYLSFITLLLMYLLFSACNKDNSPNTLPLPGNDDTTLAIEYRDSIFYVSNKAEDSIVAPLKAMSGTWYGFPEGLDIDSKTGAINVTRSESGLKYLITYISDDNKDTLTSFITIAGINYKDGFYNLSTQDSIANPIYNGDTSLMIPGINNGSEFDIGDGCNSQGCNVIPVSGQINLAQTVRNGIFGSEPANNERKEFELIYKLNDQSSRAPLLNGSKLLAQLPLLNRR